MKWMLICILSAILAVVSLAGCTKRISMDTVANEPSFKGTVAAVYEGSVLVRVDKGEAAHNSSDLIVVSLDVLLKDSTMKLAAGDVIRVYYDGTIAESHPAQVNTVYAITIVEPAPLPGSAAE